MTAAATARASICSGDDASRLKKTRVDGDTFDSVGVPSASMTISAASAVISAVVGEAAIPSPAASPPIDDSAAISRAPFSRNPESLPPKPSANPSTSARSPSPTPDRLSSLERLKLKLLSLSPIPAKIPASSSELGNLFPVDSLSLTSRVLPPISFARASLTAGPPISIAALKCLAQNSSASSLALSPPVCTSFWVFLDSRGPTEFVAQRAAGFSAGVIDA